MATQRYISTSFWDDAWIRKLSVPEKLIYMYLMTNTLTNIAGVYKATIDRMVFDTGAEEADILDALKRFEEDKKAFFYKEHIILPSWPKHQKWEQRSKIKTGIDTVLRALPKSILLFLSEVRYCYNVSSFIAIAYDDISEPIHMNREEPNYSDSEFDLDSEKSILSGKPDGADFSWEPLDYLCQKSGHKYQRTASNLSRLKARYRDGYTLEQFKAVIDSKFAEWSDKDGFEKYLRPETIFSSKFDTYLAQAVPKSEAEQGSAESDPFFDRMLGLVSARNAERVAELAAQS